MDPAAEYSRRLKDRTQTRDRLEQRHRFIGNARVTVAICAVVIGFFVFGRPTISPWWLVLPVCIFAVLAVWHAKVIEKRDHAARAVRYYEKGVARLENRWIGQGESGEAYKEPDHVYADDLDLFGRGSLFELLCDARTQTGELTLARWLKAPAAIDEVLARQQAIAELRGRVDLREALASLAEVVRSNVKPEALWIWGEKPP